MGFFDLFRRKAASSGEETPDRIRPREVDLPLSTERSGSVVDAVGDFALRLAVTVDGNLVCSSLSIFDAWLRVWAGACGACRAELDAALGLDRNEDAAREELSALLRAIDAATHDACAIRSANAIWVRPGLSFEDDFEERWGGSTRELDFSDPHQAAETVNGWISEQTEGLIRDVVDERQISPETAMMLANAIYLKAEWASVFAHEATRPDEFTLLGGQSMEVPTMHDTGHYSCAKTADFELLTRPYAGGRLAFVIVLPASGRFREVRQGLSWATVRSVLEATESCLTHLSLPKFSLTSSPRIDPFLQSQGATRIYSPTTSDLSRMSPQALTPGEELFVGQTTHRARIDVDEEGTEAAAATVVEVLAGAAPQAGPTLLPYEFVVDRPFLYFVIESTTGAALFSGHVLDPR